MTRSIPSVFTRAAFVDARTGVLTREGALLLDGLRNATGGDAARVVPNDAVGALSPVAAVSAVMVPLWPVAVTAGGADLAPVASCAGGADLAPVAIPGEP